MNEDSVLSEADGKDKQIRFRYKSVEKFQLIYNSRQMQQTALDFMFMSVQPSTVTAS